MGKAARSWVGIRSGIALLALTGGLAFAVPASAATIKVPGDFNKIQDAVDDADPGDTIAVSKKTNIENVVVPVEDLTIVGAKKGVVVDGYDGSDDYQFLAQADGLKIENLEMRNGSGFDCSGYDRCSVNDVSFRGDLSTYCFYASGDKAAVTNSSLRACGSSGVSISGNDAKVTGNSIERTDDNCIDITGNDAIVKNNKLRGCEDDDAIYIGGDRALAQNNTAKSVDGSIVEILGDKGKILNNTGSYLSDDCFNVTGDDLQAKGNKGKSCDGEGVDVEGADAKLSNNSFTGLDGSGIKYTCATTCGDAEITGNVTKDTVEDDYGMDFSITGSGSVLIAENVVTGATDDGFYFSGSNSKVVDNVIRDSGNEHEDGFDISGDDNVLTGNQSISNGGDGFSITGDDNTLKSNSAKDNDGDGFALVSGSDDDVFTSNVATANKADGFENGGANTVFKKNEASKNRRDCANDGTIAEKQGNKCADGSDFNEPSTASRKGRA